MRIGVHVSIAGHIYESLERAKSLGCNTMQIFSRNPRGWQVSGLDPGDIKEFKKLKMEYDISPVAVHIPYIINLATPDDVLYKRSISAYIGDIKRSDTLGAEYFVTHLGSHIGSGEDEGIERFSAALNEIIKNLAPKVMILMENTAGSGDSIGSKFAHLRRIIDGLDDANNIGVCLDTAHMFEAGYDIKNPEGLDDAFKEFDKLLDLNLIKVVHFNDSKSVLGSHVDRHEHLGKGEIGLQGMARIINHPALANAAFIMETPKKTDKDDMRNIAAAKRMVKAQSSKLKVKS